MAFPGRSSFPPRAAIFPVVPIRSTFRDPANAARDAEFIVFNLGEVLARVPPHLVASGLHDSNRPLRFKTEQISAELGRARAAVDLKTIIAQCPEVFVPEAREVEDMAIRLPVQRLVEQITAWPAAETARNPSASTSLEWEMGFKLEAPPFSGAPTVSAAPDLALSFPASTLTLPLTSAGRTWMLRELQQECDALAALPGIQACVIIGRTESVRGGDLPADCHPRSLRDFARQINGSLATHQDRLGTGAVQDVTLLGERTWLTFFIRAETCVCAIHRVRIFLPGVREKFEIAADDVVRLA